MQTSETSILAEVDIAAPVIARALCTMEALGGSTEERTLGTGLAADASRPSELTCEWAVHRDWRVLSSDDQLWGSLSAWTRARPPGQSPISADAVRGFTARLWKHAAESGVLECRALDVVLQRACQPAAALLTWPADTLFDARQRSRLGPYHVRRAIATHARTRWRPGADADYEGYVCVIAKLTRYCNLRCTYCHDWRAGPDQTMRFEVLVSLFQKLLEGDYSRIDFVWHGGEPTLLGRKAVLRILALQEWFRRPGQRITNILQTNGTNVDDDWAELFRRYQFRVGVSIDGPPALHDRTRVDDRGRPTHGRVETGLAALRRQGIEPGVIQVVGSDSIALGAERVMAFLREIGARKAAFLPERPTGDEPDPSEHFLSAADYCRFLLDVQAARKRSDDAIAVREVDAAEMALAGRGGGLCELAGNCAGAFFSVEPSGEIRHCDKFGRSRAYDLGNVATVDFRAIRSGPALRALRAEGVRGTKHYESCPYFRFCRGWCPHERAIASVVGVPEDAPCCGLSALFRGLEAGAGTATAGVSAGPASSPNTMIGSTPEDSREDRQS